jgi:hypothetical protein
VVAEDRSKNLGIVLCILLLLAFQTRASGDVSQQQWADVEVMAVSCPQDSDQVPAIQASAFNRQDAPLQMTVTALRSVKVAAGVYHITFSLPAGTYFIRAVTFFCRGSQMATLIAGATRHIPLTLSETRMALLSPSCAIAGALPIKGITAELLSESGTKWPIVVDGYVYDAERLSRGIYTLRLDLTDGVYADYVFDLSKEQPGEFCDHTYIRNISIDDLRRDAHQGSRKAISPTPAGGH